MTMARAARSGIRIDSLVASWVLMLVPILDF